MLPLDKSFLVSIWLETLTYGLYCCLFYGSVYIHVSVRRLRNRQYLIIFGLGVVMFFNASLHLALNLYRMISAFTDHATETGGPTLWLHNIRTWHYILKNIVYGAQETVGDVLAIYRCWILWDRNWKVIVLPTLLCVAGTVSGLYACGLYTVIKFDGTPLDPRVDRWSTVFFVITTVQSAITTGPMAYRIWKVDRDSSRYRVTKGSLRPVLKIILESASLLFFTEIVTLALFVSKDGASYIVQEPTIPLVGITFTAISIRSYFATKAIESDNVQFDTNDASIVVQRAAINLNMEAVPLYDITAYAGYTHGSPTEGRERPKDISDAGLIC